jgi:hypothetical protein
MLTKDVTIKNGMVRTKDDEGDGTVVHNDGNYHVEQGPGPFFYVFKGSEEIDMCSTLEIAKKVISEDKGTKDAEEQTIGNYNGYKMVFTGGFLRAQEDGFTKFEVLSSMGAGGWTQADVKKLMDKIDSREKYGVRDDEAYRRYTIRKEGDLWYPYHKDVRTGQITKGSGFPSLEAVKKALDKYSDYQVEYDNPELYKGKPSKPFAIDAISWDVVKSGTTSGVKWEISHDKSDDSYKIVSVGEKGTKNINYSLSLSDAEGKVADAVKLLSYVDGPQKYSKQRDAMSVNEYQNKMQELRNKAREARNRGDMKEFDKISEEITKLNKESETKDSKVGFRIEKTKNGKLISSVSFEVEEEKEAIEKAVEASKDGNGMTVLYRGNSVVWKRGTKDKQWIQIKITFQNGEVWEQNWDHSLEDAKGYYMGGEFNLGHGDGKTSKVVKVEEIR